MRGGYRLPPLPLRVVGLVPTPGMLKSMLFRLQILLSEVCTIYKASMLNYIISTNDSQLNLLTVSSRYHIQFDTI